MASRRAFADEYAVRVNRAVELLAELAAADAVRALQAEHALSERQARRYVNAAQSDAGRRERAGAHGGVHGPVGAVVDRRSASARAVAWADAERDGRGGGEAVSRSRPRATRWQGALRSSSSADRLASARLAQAYEIAVPERRR